MHFFATSTTFILSSLTFFSSVNADIIGSAISGNGINGDDFPTSDIIGSAISGNGITGGNYPMTGSIITGGITGVHGTDVEVVGTTTKVVIDGTTVFNNAPTNAASTAASAGTGAMATGAMGATAGSSTHNWAPQRTADALGAGAVALAGMAWML